MRHHTTLPFRPCRVNCLAMKEWWRCCWSDGTATFRSIRTLSLMSISNVRTMSFSDMCEWPLVSCSIACFILPLSRPAIGLHLKHPFPFAQTAHPFLDQLFPLKAQRFGSAYLAISPISHCKLSR